MARKRDRGFPADPEPLPVPVVDNHTHLDHIGAVLPDDVPAPTPAEHLARAAAAGVDRVVQVGCDLESARWTAALLSPSTAGSGARVDVSQVLGAVAIHPNEATLHAGVDEVGPDGLEPESEERHGTSLDDAIAEIADLARRHERIRAIGETGMDLFRTGPKGEAVQRESFRAHIALAKELGLALQIHDRDAHTQVIEVLLADGAPERTVFHCFSGDAEMARVCAERGWYLSFAGPVTFRPNDGLRAALAETPRELLLLETDAPYLTPHPFRGRPNAPFAAVHTARFMADFLGADLGKLCSEISAASEAVYGNW
ncbi:TatD family hydrolase [Myceligenerans pegani]|uniref:TatD family hydrolase n=1 Tax=Myceligenerans pegani TaxID=2776917 RepID=A0ABR9MTC0_9MICO|nr:TatD family hydrolase [Myceligenerans sp. TRM 65318]MBE1874623.1 TatD family hydrolase [Myceligenerans sp. TRM 65318]MBE3016894.1 TatD family hydrolase [Myceligenerans sp. TRM 65318]